MPPKKKIKVDTKTMSCSHEEAVSSGDSDQETGKGKRKKQKPTAAGSEKVLQNKTITDFNEQDFTNKSTTVDGKEWNFKIASWNVDGIRAWVKKGGLEYLKHEKPDILCLQETKCPKSKLPGEVNVAGFHTFWCDGESEGYAGVALYSKIKPLKVSYGIGMPEFDKEGRLIVAEYENFHLINVYVPNAGRKLVTLPKRLEWNPKFQSLVKELDAIKPVIICGDMNVAHEEIDIANPKPNKRNAGFTQEERDGFTELLSAANLTDCFRHKHPGTKGAYTFWTYLSNARKKNIGWRLDYVLLSKQLFPGLCDCVLRSEVFGSDHCPVVTFLQI